jgi:hypothetical protein
MAEERSGGARENAVLSERLGELATEIMQGQAPNYGRFCGHCYTPLGEERTDCPHCGRDASRLPPVERIPDRVLAMFRRKRRRESIIVNSFAYLGLALGVGLFLLLFLVYSALWWRILDIGVLVLSSRLFAAVLGGVIGDEVGYRFAQRRLAEEWGEFTTQREGPPTGKSR